MILVDQHTESYSIATARQFRLGIARRVPQVALPAGKFGERR